MDFQLEDGIASLAATPATLHGLLRGRSEAWLNCRKAEGTFSPKDVVGHLIYAEKVDWIPRARQILDGRGHLPFPPFDRRGHESLVQGRGIGELLLQFTGLRIENLETLRGFGLEDRHLEMTGTHPEFGPVTLRQLLATWVVHDLGHIAQIMRVMSNEYRDAVGPWRAYLTIVQ